MSVQTIPTRDLEAIYRNRDWAMPDGTRCDPYGAPPPAASSCQHRIAIACVLIAAFNLAYFGVRLASALL
jgi:hypothetical protein